VSPVVTEGSEDRPRRIKLSGRPAKDVGERAPRRHSPLAFTGKVGALLVVIIAVIGVLVWQNSSYDSTDGGHVAIVRNGGPFDNTRIRQVLPASSGRTNIGLFSSMHPYPTSQRFYTISSSGNGDSDESVTVPTADGVQVGIEGSAYFTLNTSPDSGYRVLKDFDNKYGTRTFRCIGSSERRDVWDGDAGFSCFLDQVVAPVINNDLRVSIGGVRCAELVASCSLVQNASASQVDPTKIGQGNVQLAKIESEISQGLADDLNSTLGGPFFADVRFNLAKVDLDPAVQKAISAAQAKFAQVSAAAADLKQAQIQAQTNEQRQKGYNACKTCQQIDILKALPGGLTTLVLGTGSGISVTVPGNK
jgi:hypothetical protein